MRSTILLLRGIDSTLEFVERHSRRWETTARDSRAVNQARYLFFSLRPLAATIMFEENAQ